MTYVVWRIIVGIYSSGTKTRQKEGKWPNGDYLAPFSFYIQMESVVASTILYLQGFKLELSFLPEEKERLGEPKKVDKVNLFKSKQMFFFLFPWNLLI